MNLYEELLKLCSEENSPFYFKDQQKDDVTYRIFNYRLASYTDFLKPGALEARGIMYRLEPSGEAVLVCRPMEKFFNLNENPFTMGLDYDDIHFAMDKLDGSLISTFIHKGQLAFKTKGSLNSEQVGWATEYVNSLWRQEFKQELDDFTRGGFTVNLEYIGPQNRIVIAYAAPTMRVLNLRDNKTGETHYSLPYRFKLASYLVQKRDIQGTPKEFVENIPHMTDIEGYVLAFASEGKLKLVKHKTLWYLKLHASKDNILIPRRLFECIIHETVDDLRSLFNTDEAALKIITDMEKKVLPIYNGMITKVEQFHYVNKHLSRKDYAIKGQQELGNFFGLGMNIYLGKPTGYKEFAVKNYKLFGIKEEDPNVTTGE